MSSVDEEIAFYRAEIAEIKAGRGIYADATDKEKRDAMLANQTAIHDLRAQGKFLMIIIFCFLAAILTCLCVLFAFY